MVSVKGRELSGERDWSDRGVTYALLPPPPPSPLSLSPMAAAADTRAADVIPLTWLPPSKRAAASNARPHALLRLTETAEQLLQAHIVSLSPSL
jgi:hypothetical protein